jgi:hypothetical protein
MQRRDISPNGGTMKQNDSAEAVLLALSVEIYERIMKYGRKRTIVAIRIANLNYVRDVGLDPKAVKKALIEQINAYYPNY